MDINEVQIDPRGRLAQWVNEVSGNCEYYASRRVAIYSETGEYLQCFILKGIWHTKWKIDRKLCHLNHLPEMEVSATFCRILSSIRLTRGIELIDENPDLPIEKWVAATCDTH